MKPLTLSAHNICAVAVEHFAAHGYDASSLNEIAVGAGMRKASLYAHFVSKNALFQTVFEIALAHEHQYIAQCFKEEAAHTGVPGQLHLERLSGRYEGSAHLRFLLRTAYFPPAEIRSVITAGFEGYLASIREDFQRAAQGRYRMVRPEALEVFCDAYLGIVDSLHVELIYSTPQGYVKRLAALSRVFSDSLSLLEGAERYSTDTPTLPHLIRFTT
ncbi:MULTISPECIES: TetR/AcrR family transcriptional regulator [unclassified Pseudomonas]|jgi:AcrR family transcriptional regulator|uniref:TetR/AcrR family transcriptional regulator n=1 Tax=unclassified Pseudomonas TaxID=196821 RepID=UPI00104019E4|nr:MULTISPECIES: TetR/AcrR family transcriptional regulator [unclassified Pseudomonas]MBB6291370.1 AcrR family transcriptional regulator [Pseudomonas sp. SJZ073]MBB6316428.1 AcrR family transcriptional regulator [Pseudomonas sp. JAI120]MCS4314210.1 AcrR family transcriptional regulator [Pseudomonas sp. BIGb0381]NJJ55956.1 helix-turn-helix transcriptional regulator [Pseudomonas sp. B14(2022)]